MINTHHPEVDAAKVASRLWIGSHPPVPGHRCGTHTTEAQAGSVDLARSGFTFLVLCAMEYQPDAEHFPGVVVHHAPFDDDAQGLGSKHMQIAVDAAAKTVQAHERGHRCLVTCFEGRNRSGLVTALALSALAGIPAAQAGEIVRERRGLAALTNPAFRGLLSRVAVERSQPDPCELCEAKPITRQYHEDAICWISDCKDCLVPMVVYREHGVAPPRRHFEHMIELLRMCGKPGRRYEVTQDMTTEPRHWHAHLRPVAAPARPR